MRTLLNRGFSLIEVLVSMALASIIIAAVYNLFHDQKDAYVAQDQVAEMQQNLRAGVLLMTQEIRSAGYDPLDTGLFGFVTDFASPNDIFSENIDYSSDKSRIAFTIDADEAGDLNPNDSELIAYRLNTSNNSLERYIWSDGDWKTVANNVDALDFVYLDDSGNVTTNPADFRAVQMTLIIRTGKKDKSYQNTQTYFNKQGQNICSGCENDNYRRRLLSTTVRIRN